MNKRTLFLLLIAAILTPFIIIIVLPDAIDAASYHPPEPPLLEDMWTPNETLKQSSLLGKGEISGPEDVDVDSQGNVYAGLNDGTIIKTTKNGKIDIFSNTHGRPLGLHFDAEGNLIVADAVKGLLSIDTKGQITPLVSEIDGHPINFADDLDIASNGVIYFSDASTRYGIHVFMRDFFEARPWGRLLSFDPSTQKTSILLTGLYFANGVALSQNEDFVLVTETTRYRVTRYWLKGPKKGTSDIFIDNLPGFPDGISSNRNGQFWLTLATLRNAQLDSLHPYPSLKNISAKLPDAFQPKPIPYGFVVLLDENTSVLATLQDPSGEHLSEITSAQQVDDKLYLGTLRGDRIGVVPLKALNIGL